MGEKSFRFLRERIGWRWALWSVLFATALGVGTYVRWRSDRLVARMTSDVDRSVDSSEGMLVIAGGGMLPHSVKEEFWKLAGGRQARIVVIPASQMEPEQLKIYEERWDEFETNSVTTLHADSRSQADDLEFSRVLESATGVWLGGGQQTWLTGWYRGTLVHERLRRLLQRGGVIGGTSAGAAVMSDVMIAGGKRDAIESRGFGFFPEAVVDQHFLKRNRMRRLSKLLEKRPDHIGLGVDERTALVVQLKGRKLSVVGDSYVTAYVPPRSDRPVRFEFLKQGDQTELAELLTPDGHVESPWDLDALLVGED